MKNKHGFFFSLSVIVLLLNACVSAPSDVSPTVTIAVQDVPGTHYEGVVTDTTYLTVNNLVQIVIINKKNQSNGCPAIVVIPPEAEIFYDEQGTLVPYDLEDIIVGQKFTVSPSEVTEGMPPGILAKRIIILDKGPQDSLTPILTWTKPDIKGVISELNKNESPDWSGVNLTIDGIDLQDNVEHLFTFLSVTEQTLIWSKDKDGYSLKEMDYLQPGQSVTVLLRNYYDHGSPGTYNPIIEIIVNPE